MSKVAIILNSRARREQAARWCMNTADGVRVTFEQGDQRTKEQNDKMHAMLSELAKQTRYHDVKLRKDDWKLLFLDQLFRQRKQDLRLVPNLDGDGFVPLSARSSSSLKIADFSDLIELIYAYGAMHGVVFQEPEPDPATPSRASLPTMEAA